MVNKQKIRNQKPETHTPMRSVPFSISSDFDALTDFQRGIKLDKMRYVMGVVRYDRDVLTLEYQTVNSFTGARDSDVHEVHLPLDELEAVEFTRRMVGTSMVLRTKSQRALQDVPGSLQGAVTLRFERKHRDQAHDLATFVALRISERKLDLLDEEMDRLNRSDDEGSDE